VQPPGHFWDEGSSNSVVVLDGEAVNAPEDIRAPLFQLRQHGFRRLSGFTVH
jgi:hypothetical protein